MARSTSGPPRERRTNLTEEFGDTLRALRNLARRLGVKWSAVKLAREIKPGERGGSGDGAILISTEGIAHRRNRLRRQNHP